MPDEPAAAAQTREARQRIVARMYGAGYSVREIRVELTQAGYKNISQPTIYRDLAALKEDWRQANLAAIEESRNTHVQQIDQDLAHLKRQGFRITEADEAGAYYASVILPLLKERAKLLGLYPPSRVDVTGFVRDWATRNGFDPDKAVKLAQEVVESQGF